MSEEALTPQENEPESASDARLRLLQAINAFVAASKPITAGVLTNEVLTRQMAEAAEQIQKSKAALLRLAAAWSERPFATALGAAAGGMKESKEAALAFAEEMRGVNEMTVSPELMRTVEEGVDTFGELARDLEDGE